jgi:hypothetical protein
MSDSLSRSEIKRNGTVALNCNETEPMPESPPALTTSQPHTTQVVETAYVLPGTMIRWTERNRGCSGSREFDQAAWRCRCRIEVFGDQAPKMFTLQLAAYGERGYQGDIKPASETGSQDFGTGSRRRVAVSSGPSVGFEVRLGLDRI